MFHRLFRAGIVLSGVLIFSMASAGENQIKVKVLSAVIKDQKIEGAKVTLQKNGETSVSGKTDAEGNVSVKAPFSGSDPATSMIIEKEGFSTLVAKCPCNDMTYAVSPKMKNLDGIRVVLNWGREPQDLDSHIMYQHNHIFWNEKIGDKANLDVDDVDGFGPETITIEKKFSGKKYVYAVQDFTHLEKMGTDFLSGSDAKVFVYIGQSLIKTYYVPKNKTGNMWIVFSIDENGEFHDINELRDVAKQKNGAYMDKSVLTSYLGLTEYKTVIPIETPKAAPQDANRLNKLGEEAYHAGKLEEAIDYYNNAIEINPNHGQAYSNLGLVYQKSGRIAESIWANRKAIALASGKSANVTRAGSYYNIAKIYEEAADFESALQNYESANKEKPGKTYDEAIKRMKEKLKTAPK